ncbi:MAG: flagellar basal body P-ring formation chaperone FlgA [Thermogutta sp.]
MTAERSVGIARSSRNGTPGRRAVFAALAFVGIFTSAAVGRAAELSLRSAAVCTGPVVTLGDLFEIRGPDSAANAALADIRLFPAPPIGERRFVSRQEIRDILALRGIDLRPHIWTGAAMIGLTSAPNCAVWQGETVGDAARRRAEERVAAAVREYLSQTHPAGLARDVQVRLDDQQAAVAATPDARVRVESDLAVGVDQRKFLISVTAAGETVRFSIDARVRAMQPVVVASRPLARDSILTAADVSLSYEAAAGNESGSPLRSLEEAIGKQLTLSVSAGRVLDGSILREPILVRRNDVVTVYTRAPGIVIRTSARAKDDAAGGQWVSVESLEVRGKPIMARVIGFREVEVLAGSIRTRER